MFLYYLVDLQEIRPKIYYLYFGKQSHISKEELINQIGMEKGFNPELIVYSRIPLTEICGIDKLCHDSEMENTPAKNIYFFYLGGYEFYYSVGLSLDDAITCLDSDLDHEKWPLIEQIVKDGKYDSFSLDMILGHPIDGFCWHDHSIDGFCWH